MYALIVDGKVALSGLINVPTWNEASQLWHTDKWFVEDPQRSGVVREVAAIQAEIVAATQERLDAFARTRHYDDIKSASDYAGCTVPKFDIEGTYCRNIRALTWDALYTMLAEVEAGTRPMPSGFADVESELPALVWPT